MLYSKQGLLKKIMVWINDLMKANKLNYSGKNKLQTNIFLFYKVFFFRIR